MVVNSSIVKIFANPFKRQEEKPISSQERDRKKSSLKKKMTRKRLPFLDFDISRMLDDRI